MTASARAAAANSRTGGAGSGKRAGGVTGWPVANPAARALTGAALPADDDRLIVIDDAAGAMPCFATGSSACTGPSGRARSNGITAKSASGSPTGSACSPSRSAPKSATPPVAISPASTRADRPPAIAGGRSVIGGVFKSVTGCICETVSNGCAIWSAEPALRPTRRAATGEKLRCHGQLKAAKICRHPQRFAAALHAGAYSSSSMSQ